MRPVSAILALAAVAGVIGCGGGSNGTTTHSVSSTSASRGESTTANRSESTSTTTQPAALAPAKARKRPNAPRTRPPNPSTPAATARVVLASHGTAGCELITPRLLKKSYGGLQGCRSALESGGQAKSVDIVSTQPEGKFALVVAVPHGGPSSGEKLAISLVKVHGDWRLDAIRSNAKVGP